MPRAKSRLPHNYGKKAYTYIEFGLIPKRKKGYRDTRSGLNAMIILGMSMALSLTFYSIRYLPIDVFAKQPIANSSDVASEEVVNEEMAQLDNDIDTIVIETPEPSPTPSPEIDKDFERLMDTSVWAVEAVDEFIPKHRQSEALMITQCLLHRESRHDEAQACGDGGKSCGSMQFRIPTWERMRKQMIKQGHAEEIGSMYDTKEAIRTAVWAMNNGNAKEWGPILRDSQGSNYASCQTPSWY